MLDCKNLILEYFGWIHQVSSEATSSFIALYILIYQYICIDIIYQFIYYIIYIYIVELVLVFDYFSFFFSSTNERIVIKSLPAFTIFPAVFVTALIEIYSKLPGGHTKCQGCLQRQITP